MFGEIFIQVCAFDGQFSVYCEIPSSANAPLSTLTLLGCLSSGGWWVLMMKVDAVIKCVLTWFWVCQREDWWKESVWVGGFVPRLLQQISSRLGNEESHWLLLMSYCSCFSVVSQFSWDTTLYNHRSGHSLLCSGKSYGGWSLLLLRVLKKKKTCC